MLSDCVCETEREIEKERERGKEREGKREREEEKATRARCCATKGEKPFMTHSERVFSKIKVPSMI